MSQDEYIRTLEAWNQLLQREIENLRHQPRPHVGVSGDPDAESLEHTSRLIQSFSSAEQVIATLQEYTARRFPVIDGSIFMVDPATNKLAPAVENSLVDARTIKVHLEEEGIIDWVIRRKKTVVIPNFHAPTPDGDYQTSYIIVPLFLRGTAVGVFIAQTPASASDFKREDIASLTILAESAAIALDNIKSASEISRMNKRLNSLNKQMMQSAKLASIGELAGSVAHEINNPLQILLGHIQLLETGVGDMPRRLSIVREQVYRISDITRRLLDFARSTPYDMAPEAVDLLSVVDEVLLFVGSQLRRDGIEVEKIADNPPPHTRGNRSQIEQVLLNLIINARDAMPDGGRLIVAVFSDDRCACITVADTGTGIQPEHLEHIFEPFFSTKPRGKGTGLGLSIAREIIRQLNGTLSVVSEPDKGTTFKIELPLATKGELTVIG